MRLNSVQLSDALVSILEIHIHQVWLLLARHLDVWLALWVVVLGDSLHLVDLQIVLVVSVAHVLHCQFLLLLQSLLLQLDLLQLILLLVLIQLLVQQPWVLLMVCVRRLHVGTCVARVVPTMVIHAWRNILLHVLIDWDLSLLPRSLLLKDLLLLLSAMLAWTFQLSLISHMNLLLADALVWALLWGGMTQNWSSFVLIIGKLWVIASCLRAFVLVLDLRKLEDGIFSCWWYCVISGCLPCVWRCLYAVPTSFRSVLLWILLLAHGVVIMRTILEVDTSCSSSLFRVVVPVQCYIIVLLGKSRRQMHDVFGNSNGFQ